MTEPHTALAIKVGAVLAKTVLTSVGRALADFQAKKGERAVAALVSALCDLSGLPPEDAAAKLDAILTSHDPGAYAAHEALYETFRLFAFTRTEAAWPHIARMTAEYVEHRRGVDDFFRRAGWLLERCEAEDVDILVRLLATTRPLITTAADDARVAWTILYPKDGGVESKAACAGVQVGSGEPPVQKVVTDSDGLNAARAADVLALVRDSRLGTLTDTFGVKLYFDRESRVLERLIALFDPVPPAS